MAFINIYNLAWQLYQSDFSKKAHLQGSRLITIPHHKFTELRGKVMSCKLRNLFSSGHLDGKSLANMTYQDLEYVKQYDVSLFHKISKKIYKQNIEQIQRKNMIRIAFFCPDSAVWSCERIYHLFEEDERFEPFIVVPGFNNGTPQTIREIYTNTLEYFTKSGYRTVGMYDGINEMGWDEIGAPDIVFHLTPYPNILPERGNIFHVPLSCLNVYLPYTIGAVDDYWLFNVPGPQLSWIWFCETECCKEMIMHHALTGVKNVVVLGHPKMDELLNAHRNYDANTIWKCANGMPASKVKKIIYAPHHSIGNDSITMSTFHENYREIYRLAKESADTTSWIVKPHPLLKKSTIKNGLFTSEKEFEDYMDMWDALPNSKTVRNGQYVDLFLTSDAMITDCVSYLTEYLCVNKPLIILRRPEQKYNKWGKIVLDAAYSVPGNDARMIQDTINTVVIQGTDPLKTVREEVVRQHFWVSERYRDGAATISDEIYDHIRSYF